MISVTLTVVLVGATSINLYFNIQNSVGSLDAGIEGTRLADQAIIDYLTGVSTADGLAGYFNEREIAHMADVYRLFRDMRVLRVVAALSGLLLIGGAALKNRDWMRTFRKGGILGFALFLLPVLAIAIWANIDFYIAFRAMHRLLFRNMLWILSPETDLMIRIYPQAFFEQIALRLALFSALFAPIPPLLMIVAPFFGRKYLRR